MCIIMTYFASFELVCKTFLIRSEFITLLLFGSRTIVFEDICSPNIISQTVSRPRWFHHGLFHQHNCLRTLPPTKIPPKENFPPK